MAQCQHRRLIGQGGMGEVYAAEDRHGEKVAIKVLPTDVSSDPERLARFDRDQYTWKSDSSQMLRAGTHVRGQSSSGQAERPYAMEFWKEDNDEDRDEPLLGMPSHSDWVLQSLTQVLPRETLPVPDANAIACEHDDFLDAIRTGRAPLVPASAGAAALEIANRVIDTLVCTRFGGVAAPTVPLVANVTAAPVSDTDEIRRLLVEQVCGTVRWRESVLAMAALGVTGFVEGGGKVLGPMIRRITPDVPTITAADMSGVEAIAAAIA